MTMQNSDQPEQNTEQLDANGWPIGFFEETAGSLPDFPEREPQGEYEERLEMDDFQILDDTAYLLASPANANRLNQAITEVENQTQLKRGTLMHIEADLDDIHAEKLLNLQEQLKQPLADILASAIDSLASQRLEKAGASNPAPLYQALENIGFIGCVETDQQLSTTYKQHLDFSHKCGTPK